MFKADFGTRQAGMILSAAHGSCEDLAGSLYFLSFSSLILMWTKIIVTPLKTIHETKPMVGIHSFTY